MRRLLMVTTVPVTLEAFMLPLARHLRAQGWRVDAMARGAREREALAEAFDHVWDVSWSRNVFDPRNLVHAPREVRRVVREGGYHVVHVHTPVAAFVTRLALRRLRRSGFPRVIYTAHGFHFYKGAPPHRYLSFLALEKLAGRWTDYLLLVNNEDTEAAHRYRLVDQDSIFHARGVGIDTAKFSPGRVDRSEVERVRAELGLAAGDPLFVCVAEFIPRKRHEDVIRAFHALAAPRAHLALAGTGPLVEPMRRLAAELGVSDRVHFLGFRRDVPALMLASSAVVLVSLHEGLPTCVLEANCLGVPVIGSDIRGTRDLLGDARGYLVPVRDVEGLRAAMRRVLDYPDEARTMAEHARASAQGHDVDTINAVYGELYSRALAKATWDDVPEA